MGRVGEALMADVESDPPTAADLKEIVAGIPFFSVLDEPSLDIVVDRLQVRKVSAGTPLFFQGEGEGEVPLYVVVSGTVRIYKASLRGREQVLRLFHPGDTFAEVPVFDGGSYPANADALVDSTVAMLPRPAFLELMQRYPEIALAATRVLSERLRYFNVLIEDLSLRRVRSRVARWILESHEDVTQSMLGNMSGASREMVNRSLHQLEDEGLIDLKKHQVVIRDPERLQQIVDEG